MICASVSSTLPAAVACTEATLRALVGDVDGRGHGLELPRRVRRAPAGTRSAAASPSAARPPSRTVAKALPAYIGRRACSLPSFTVELHHVGDEPGAHARGHARGQVLAHRGVRDQHRRRLLLADRPGRRARVALGGVGGQLRRRRRRGRGPRRRRRASAARRRDAGADEDRLDLVPPPSWSASRRASETASSEGRRSVPSRCSAKVRMEGIRGPWLRRGAAGAAP